MKALKLFRSDVSMMRIFRVSLVTCIASAFVGTALGQATDQPFTLTIEAAKPSVNAGSNVFIKATLTNVSTQNVDCTEAEVGAAIVSYDYDVRDEEGKPVSKRDMSFPYTGKHWDICSLEPGKTVKRDLLLSWLFDFSKPGKYVVQLSRRTSVDTNGLRTGDRVKSNTVTITVLPADAPPTTQQ
jgi:hypothetical protein